MIGYLVLLQVLLAVVFCILGKGVFLRFFFRVLAFIFTAQVHANGTFDIFVSGMSLQVQRTTMRMAIQGTVSDTGKVHITKPLNVATGDGQITGTSLNLKCVYIRTPRVVNYYDLRLKRRGS